MSEPLVNQKRDVTSSDSSLRCLLCGHSQADVLETLTREELDRLWRAMGHEFAQEGWGKLGVNHRVALHRCRDCGFAYFDPGLAGEEAFYAALDHPDYFSSDRPEFARTLEFARRRGLVRVLDVGCGSGRFLDLAKAAGHDTCGLELNSRAAAKAKNKGHTIFGCLLNELQPDHVAGGFDLITFFQVLEHVAAPPELMRQADAVLKPGGCIAVSVPSAEGVYRLCPLDPHQWPPHHISRWRLIDFQQLAKAGQTRLIESGGDVLLGSDIEHLWKLHNKLATVLGRKRRLGGDELGRLISLAYRATRMKHIFPAWGSSIYGYFERVSSSATL